MPPKAVQYKGKILFIHGYTQSASIFYAKTSALRKKLIKLQYKPIYLNAPLTLTPTDLPPNYASQFSTVASEDGFERSYRAWWVKPNNSNENINIDQAIDTIRNYITNGEILAGEDDSKDAVTEDDKNLPVVGLIGFSQGGALAGLIAPRFSELFNVEPNSLKFAVVYSGYRLDTSKKAKNYKYNHLYTHEESEESDLRYLHVIGELDTVCDEERNMELYNLSSEKSTILKHPGGHFVPNSRVTVDQVTNWLQQEKEVKEEKKEEEEKKDDLEDILAMLDSIGKI